VTPSFARRPAGLRCAACAWRSTAETGQWVDKPNYFDVTVFGAQGENCAQYLAKGRPVAVEGRLNWREWEAQDGAKRQAVDIIADAVQFLGSRDAPQTNGAVESDIPADTSDFQEASVGSGSDDDIPF
jgi:single-strand DNA-binding protein